MNTNLDRSKGEWEFTGAVWATALITALAIRLGWETLSGGIHSLLQFALNAQAKGGGVLLALAPLVLWLGWITLKQICGRAAGRAVDLDLGYIARNAMLFGVAGTVCGLIGSTTKLATEVSKGSAAVVLGLIPEVGKALLATLSGVAVAIAADFLLHLRERRKIHINEPSP